MLLLLLWCFRTVKSHWKELLPLIETHADYTALIESQSRCVLRKQGILSSSDHCSDAHPAITLRSLIHSLFSLSVFSIPPKQLFDDYCEELEDRLRDEKEKIKKQLKVRFCRHSFFLPRVCACFCAVCHASSCGDPSSSAKFRPLTCDSGVPFSLFPHGILDRITMCTIASHRCPPLRTSRSTSRLKRH